MPRQSSNQERVDVPASTQPYVPQGDLRAANAPIRGRGGLSGFLTPFSFFGGPVGVASDVGSTLAQEGETSPLELLLVAGSGLIPGPGKKVVDFTEAAIRKEYKGLLDHGAELQDAIEQVTTAHRGVTAQMLRQQRSLTRRLRGTDITPERVKDVPTAELAFALRRTQGLSGKDAVRTAQELQEQGRIYMDEIRPLYGRTASEADLLERRYEALTEMLERTEELADKLGFKLDLD